MCEVIRASLDPNAVAEICAHLEKYFRRIFETEHALLRKKEGELNDNISAQMVSQKVEIIQSPSPRSELWQVVISVLELDNYYSQSPRMIAIPKITPLQSDRKLSKLKVNFNWKLIPRPDSWI